MTKPMANLRTALVTGASKRVGRRVSEALLADGWRLFAHVHSNDDAVAEGATRLVGDLSAPDIGETLFAAIGGPVDLLVNCAARFGDDALGRLDPGEFEQHMAINVRAPALLIDALARRHAAGAGAGRRALVVNVLDAKLAAPNPDFLSYTLSKYALAGLTEVAARALADKGIRVNAVAPALMLPSGEQSDEEFEKVHAFNPLRHGVEVDELVAAVRFLLDSPAMTGQTLVLDGGQRFMALPRDVQFLDEAK
ncbi:SDR family oxidoreductase [Sphingomonas sp. ASV193]|uniref:SDR family oxidoreductase n=1 Tax=Sphingomonas sp. ASV193 TaxID=3144405 RepID=UPI0032E8A72E